MRMRLMGAMMLALGGAAASAQPGNVDRVAAALSEPGGREIGQASVEREGENVRVRIALNGLAAGRYGAHIHRTGRCEGPAFESAGAHWNPTGQQHGFDNPSGRHRGDLPNVRIGANGRGSLTFVIRGARLRGESAIMDADGAAVVIHASADDYRTDPSGNSGARIACGILN